MENQNKWLEDFLACRKNYDKENTDVWKYTLQVLNSAFKEGAIGAKEKHLMALCIGITDHCPPCTLGHLKAAIKLGATKEELLETIGVTLSMGGTTAMGGAWMVFKMMEEEHLF
ncbi:MAG: carboxymuconolactone decarboxylase family protein [Candidatus Eremiobacterota bacterium]